LSAQGRNTRTHTHTRTHAHAHTHTHTHTHTQTYTSSHAPCRRSTSFVGLIAVAPHGVGFSLVVRRRSSQVQRLDATSRSPIQALIVESLQGASTIRAFGLQVRTQWCAIDVFSCFHDLCPVAPSLRLALAHACGALLHETNWLSFRTWRGGGVWQCRPRAGVWVSWEGSFPSKPCCYPPQASKAVCARLALVTIPSACV
jgi:hypothetical protein